MKLRAGDIAAFLQQPDPAVGAALIYGPDEGLARERAETLSAAIVPDRDDPFRLIRLDASALKDDPARLADEAAAMAFGGGRRVIRVRGAADGQTDAFANALDGPAFDALIIAEAGDLGPRSKLRKLFEGHERAAALPCYADDGAGLQRLVRESLGAHGLVPSADALGYLAAHLGDDRMINRAELEKLALYVGQAPPGAQTEVSLEQARAVVGDNAALALEDLVYSVTGGDSAAVARILVRLFNEGVQPVAILRAVQRHMQRLHLVRAAMADGANLEGAMRALRPPVFFKRADQFRAQARRWPAASLARAAEALTEAEVACKTTGQPDQAICEELLLRFSAGAARIAGRHSTSKV